MKLKLLATALSGAILVPAAAWAQAAPTITVVTTLAPNAYGSPSFATWEQNTIAAMRTGSASYGTAGLPTYFEARSNVNTAEVVVTGFNSWLGKADPGTAFGSAFAAELGNRMTFALRIDGNGTQFSIDQLSFNAVSTDAPYNALNFGWAAGSYAYGTGYVGLLKGQDGLLFTSDDVLITSGPASQLVDGLVGRGSGNSFAAYCTGCTLAEQQAAIDEVAAYPGFPFTFTGTYSLGSTTGSGTFNINPVPEPASWAMMIIGFGMAGAAMRRNRARQVRFT